MYKRQGIEGQARQSLENIKHILEEAGLTMGNIAKTTVFLPVSYTHLITVANLYNIKKRALAALAHLAMNDKKKYENKR